MSRCIAADFYDRALLPEHMHAGFCFLDSKDVQFGPHFPTLESAVAWLHTQSQDVLARITLVPEAVLADD